jgi:hypothetical protein
MPLRIEHLRRLVAVGALQYPEARNTQLSVSSRLDTHDAGGAGNPNGTADSRSYLCAEVRA